MNVRIGMSVWVPSVVRLLYLFLSVCMYVCMYVRMYVCMYVCFLMHLDILMYRYLYAWRGLFGVWLSGNFNMRTCMVLCVLHSCALTHLGMCGSAGPKHRLCFVTFLRQMSKVVRLIPRILRDFK